MILLHSGRPESSRCSATWCDLCSALRAYRQLCLAWPRSSPSLSRC